MIDSDSRRKFNELRLDALSIPHCVIKKGRCHGARHGKTEVQREHHLAWNAWKRCCKIVDSQVEHIHDRFLRDQVFCVSQLAIGWTEQKCKEMDELAKQNHTYHLSTEEFERYQGQWYLTLNKSGKNGPMRLRPDFRAAVSLKNRLHRESGATGCRTKFSTAKKEMARGMGSPKHVSNRRRRTREVPEPACVQTPKLWEWHMQGRKHELTSCRGTVQSAWQKPPARRKGGRAGLPKKR